MKYTSSIKMFQMQEFPDEVSFSIEDYYIVAVMSDGLYRWDHSTGLFWENGQCGKANIIGVDLEW